MKPWNEATEILYLKDLASELEAHWENPSLRGRPLKELRESIARLPDAKIAGHLKKLLPELSKPQPQISLAAIRAPIDRAYDLTVGNQILEGDRLHPVGEKVPAIVLLENIRSAYNVGSILRTSEVVGFEKVILCGYTPDPSHPQVKKTAQGAESSILWNANEDILSVIRILKDQGYLIAALETDNGSTNIFEFEATPPTALILGNERFGITPQTLGEVDSILEIPVFGKKRSLNVASAFSVAAYQIRNHLTG